MFVSEIALTLEELLEDEAVAGLTNGGARATSFAHRSLDGTCETGRELSVGESSVQTIACGLPLVVQHTSQGPVSAGDDRLWTGYPSGIDLLWYKWFVRCRVGLHGQRLPRPRRVVEAQVAPLGNSMIEIGWIE